MRSLSRLSSALLGAAAALTAACGDDTTTVVPPDLTRHCDYQPMTANADIGTIVTVAPLTAGAGEAAIDVPVGTALGGYTARAGFLGNAGVVDGREVAISGGFHPSVGVETRPMAKAVALKTGVETVLWIKLDAIFVYEGMVFDLERKLGAEYRGKILLTASHSHSAWAQYTAHSPLKVGGGDFRQLVYDRFLAAAEAAAREAIVGLRPAKLGIFTDANFDPSSAITRDRRGANDDLPGGNRKDDRLHLIRIDGTDGQPIAVVPIYGVHGTLNGEDNPLASTDSVGGAERALEETFDRKVVVMHLQSAGADTSPTPRGGVDCSVHPGPESDPCLGWLSAEGHGRTALPTLQAAWTAAGGAMKESIALSMVTRSIELGPYPETFSIRGGALEYAPFDLERLPDRQVWNGEQIISPIDEFNAPKGAALCETETALFPAAAMPGVEGLEVYGSCVRLDVAGEVLSSILELSFPDIEEGGLACQSTRTTISALWLDDYLMATIPGELSVLLADQVRAASPLDSAHTIAVGYAQGHVGYALTPEDWLQGGYEPSVSFWGPLEGEYLVERQGELMPLAMAATRLDGAADGDDRVAVPLVEDTFPIDAPAPMAGQVPAAVTEDLWMRAGRPPEAQPAAMVPRVTGLATFVWLGDDPSTKTPIVTLERESGGAFAPITRRSGRAVTDGDLLLVYAPSPLVRLTPTTPQEHVWAVEWQPVPWRGAGNGLDELERRGGVPLGRYRFNVAGDGWQLTSRPFEVVAGPLALTVQRMGTRIETAASWDPRKGFRLMTLDGPSNRNVPLAGQELTVTALNGAGVAIGAARTVTADASGKVSIDYAASAPMVASLRVADRDGNTGTIVVPAP